MAKKLTVNKLALGNLKTRKKQYAVMLIGMIFAMIFLSGILFLFSSLKSSFDNMQAINYGNADTLFINADEKTVNEAIEKDYFKEAGYAHVIGYGFTDNEYKGTSIGWLDENGKKLANHILLEGDFPKAENEIAVESGALSAMNIKARVGESITLNFRVQNGEKTFEEQTEKTYTLVGILKNKRVNLTVFAGADNSDILIPAALVADNTQTELGGREALVAYLDGRGKSEETYDFINKKMGDYGNVIFASKYSQTGKEDANDAQNTVIFTAIIIAVLAGVSCLGIISSFNANLKARKKQIGLLRAVGATKRQIINIFGREAFIISLIVTPVSVLISYFAVRGVIGLLGESFVFVPDWRVLILCALFSVFSVMLASLIPLVSASKISPMQSIRNIETSRKMHKKHIKTKKQFDVSSLISKRAMTFSRFKQVFVSIVLAVSVFLSCFVFSWYVYAKDLYSHIDADYTLMLAHDTNYSYVNYETGNSGFSENDRQEILSNYYVDSVSGVKEAAVNMLVPFTNSDYRKLTSRNYNNSYPDSVGTWEERWEFERGLTSENIREFLFTHLKEDYLEAKNKLGFGEFISVRAIAFDESVLSECDRYVYDGKINTEKLNSGEEIILVAPKKIGLLISEDKHVGIYDVKDEYVDEDECLLWADCDFKAGEKLSLSTVTAGAYEGAAVPEKFEKTDSEATIGALFYELPSGRYFDLNDIIIITTVKGLDRLVAGRSYKNLDVFLNTECNDEIDTEIRSVMKPIADSVSGGYYTSEYDFQKEQKTDTTRAIVAGVAVLILFYAVCIVIINNSLTASIRESKTKIGTLRAVGATRRELVKIYIKELLSMLLWGLGGGFASFSAVYILGMIILKDDLDLKYNPLGALVFAAITFIICTANLYLKIRAEMKNSIIDNIREL